MLFGGHLMQALMLAAGMGKRLMKYTKNNTKCMVEVAGEKLIDRAIRSIKEAGIQKFIIVTGYKADNLKQYILDTHGDDLEYVFIENKDYATTNNIYSFYLAKDELIKDDTILLESDLIFDNSLIKKMVEAKDENLVALAKYESWMDGTVTTIDENGYISKFISKEEIDIKKLNEDYKTVNVYKFSKDFSKEKYIPFLEAYIKSYGLGVYYELVLKVLAGFPDVKLKGYLMEDMPWYEIDDAQDLDIAHILFSHGKDKYDRIISKFGGYWRYGKIIDFCYLVNPYFPPKQFVEKLQDEFPTLLTQYPSGLKMQNMNAERIFDVNEDYLLVGNGAAELINAFGHLTKGKIAVNLPTFNEYVRCFKNAEIIKINNSTIDYKLSVELIKNAIDVADTVAIINPENPSGFMLDKVEILNILEYDKGKNVRIIVDESFVDFANKERRFTLLDNKILEAYPNLIVIKSISKSYGVPGLRLGVLASSDLDLLKDIKDDMQVWNINSFAEYYLQTYNLFAKTYKDACDKIADERNYVINELRQIKDIKVYDSEANYIMIDLKEHSSYEFAINMLDKHNILIKDLSSKNYFEGKNFIRIAIRDRNDNNIMIDAFKKTLNI